MGGPFLELQVRKSYPGFSLEVEAAFEDGVTAIFGPSGSGKTTLLDCIAGLVTPDSGRVAVAGRLLYSSSPRVDVPPERRRLGYVFQEGLLFPHMTAWQNILYGYRLTPPGARRIEPDHLVELLGLTALLDRRVPTLSGGEAQRVALARALATSPELLLLDEPLASLDAPRRGAVLAYLRRVRDELHTSMLYVSHSISEVLALADNVLALDRGRMAAFGPPRRLLYQPSVYPLVGEEELENIVEAEVVGHDERLRLTEARLGRNRLLLPLVDRPPGSKLVLAVGASDPIISLNAPEGISAQNLLAGRIESVHVVERRALVFLDAGVPLVVQVGANAVRKLELREGLEVYLILKATTAMLMDPGPGQSERKESDT